MPMTLYLSYLTESNYFFTLLFSDLLEGHDWTKARDRVDEVMDYLKEYFPLAVMVRLLICC